MKPAPQPILSSSPAAPKPWIGQRGLLRLLLLTVIARCVVAALRQLVPDEAYYWVWSRQLQPSYFDHPPMVAYLIRLGTVVGGNTELGVRWPAALLVTLLIIAVGWITQKLYGLVAASMAAVVFALCPFVWMLGCIMTPDTPAVFFSSLALCTVLNLFSAGESESLQRAKTLWPLFGLLMGLALLSKYTCVFLGVAVLLVLLFDPSARKHLKTPWPWLAALTAVAVFSPVIYWNGQHHWASFRFQLLHGTRPKDHVQKTALAILLRELEYIGGQLAVATPVLFAMGVAAIIAAINRKPINTITRILLFSTLVPLIYFAYAAIGRKRIEGNWPVFAYVPMTLLIVGYVSQTCLRDRIRWFKLAVIVALAGTILINVPEVAWMIYPKMHASKWDEPFGWRELATHVNLKAQANGFADIFTSDYEYAAELSFYLPGQPTIFPLEGSDRPTEYDYMSPHPTAAQSPRIVYVRKHEDGPDVKIDERLIWLFENPSFPEVWKCLKFRHVVRQAEITVAPDPRPPTTMP